METKILDTIIMDGMYMDIESIEFKFNDNYEELLTKCRKILEENNFLSSVSINLFNQSELSVIKYFNSTSDDEYKTEDVDSRIDTEMLIVYSNSVYYRGYSKWTSDFLEVEL